MEAPLVNTWLLKTGVGDQLTANCFGSEQKDLGCCCFFGREEGQTSTGWTDFTSSREPLTRDSSVIDTNCILPFALRLAFNAKNGADEWLNRTLKPLMRFWLHFSKPAGSGRTGWGTHCPSNLSSRTSLQEMEIGALTSHPEFSVILVLSNETTF